MSPSIIIIYIAILAMVSLLSFRKGFQNIFRTEKRLPWYLAGFSLFLINPDIINVLSKKQGLLRMKRRDCLDFVVAIDYSCNKLREEWMKDPDPFSWSRVIYLNALFQTSFYGCHYKLRTYKVLPACLNIF